MATSKVSAKPVPPSAPSPRASGPEAGPPTFRFDVGNEPNADILLQSLRSAGYSLESVIGDLADNSIDAGANLVVVNIDIDLKTEEWIIEVADDGSGMDLEVLDEMMRLGSRVDHDLSSDLGAFGLGSDTSALAIGRNKHVVTSYEVGAWASSMWDLDVIIQKKRFVKHLGEAGPEEIGLFRSAFERGGIQTPETGSLVRVTKCDRIGRRSLGPAIKTVLKYIGETYRRFLAPNGGLTIIVNGETAEPIDPMMRNHSGTMTLLDEQFDFDWSERGKHRSEKIGALVVHLPDFGGPEANKDAGITIDRSGYYILRNGREIAGATTLGAFARHNEFARFRCELNIPAALDSQLGVTFLKSSFELRPTQALRDKIESVVGPYRRQSRKLYLKSRPNAPEQVPHEEAAKQIKARSPFLRKPVAEIERRRRRVGETRAAPTETKEATHARLPRESVQKALADVAEFEAKSLGVTAPFYDGALIGRKILITYNSDHPAYQRLILENRENRAQITAMDFLVWSLVSAELRNVDDDSSRFMEAMREDASFNLRQLLTP